MKTLNYIWALLFLGGLSLQAQVDVQFAENGEGCETGQYCADLQIKTNADSDILVGNSSIRFNYDPQVLSFFGSTNSVTTGSYSSRLFDETYNCTAFGENTQPYAKHAFDGTVDGDFLITVLLENYLEQAECAGLQAEWMTLSTICFDIIDETADPKLVIKGTESGIVQDLSGTNFNAASNNPADKYSNGEFRALNTSAQEVCETASGIKTVSASNFSWSIAGIAPMPAQENLFISLNMDENAEVTVKLFDLNGRLIMEQDQKVAAGTAKVELDVRNLASGAYLLSVSKGAEVLADKIVKE